uniref:Hyaluronidase n=1 Tax=Otolemur garnettii TaxID=30611 RepID=H0XQH5_OTOGA
MKCSLTIQSIFLIFPHHILSKRKREEIVLAFLLIPCCLAQDYRARPILPKVSFLWAWNAPTEPCVGASNQPLDLSLFTLIGSPRKDALGQDVTIFYVDRLGYYPYIDHKGKLVNGGIPQKGSLQNHLDKARNDIIYYIPKDKVGMAVIDWEEWRPTWARNWRPKDIYRNLSIDYVQQKNATLSVAEATKIAKDEFETIGKAFMLDTLRLGISIRPKHYWGYYLFPDCYNTHYKQANYNGSCFYIEKKRNDDLEWLWKESTALYPSIYLNTQMTPDRGALYVRNRVHEAIRVSKVRNAADPLPVFVYTRLVFTDDVMKFLSEEDLVHTFGETISQGASGIVIWGSLTLLRAAKKTACLDLENYMQKTVNPYIINASLAAKMCSQVLCAEQGVCTRKDWNSDAYLHLNPHNFAIQMSTDGQYLVSGKPTIDDLQELADNFQCTCFTNTTCETRTNVTDVSSINVCINDGLCIDA